MTKLWLLFFWPMTVVVMVYIFLTYLDEVRSGLFSERHKRNAV